MSMVFSERYPASASSVRAARHDAIRALMGAGFSDRDLHSRVALALSEATGNVVQHAYPSGPVEYCMDVVINETAGAVVIAVTDYGVGMNGAETRTRLPSMGLGLSLMRAQTSSVEIHPDTNGTTITLHFEGSWGSA
jgi:anti-sigma regulatory factor (Ser/Thr protein kinase)